MSYRYNQYRDTFEHIPDEQPITVNYSFPQFQVVRYVELSQECIDQIADAVVRKLKREVDICGTGGLIMAEYIDKNKAINAVFEAFADGRSAYIALEALPAADVRPARHGRWRDGVYAGYRCSECRTTWDAPTKFCPNCGAKMDGGEE